MNIFNPSRGITIQNFYDEDLNSIELVGSLQVIASIALGSLPVGTILAMAASMSLDNNSGAPGTIFVSIRGSTGGSPVDMPGIGGSVAQNTTFYLPDATQQVYSHSALGYVTAQTALTINLAMTPSALANFFTDDTRLGITAFIPA